MTRLIVEEGGVQRAFRLGDGVLTVGSGPDAKLRLKSTDVAEIHLELRIQDGVVRARPRPGVLPPRVDGTSLEEGGVLAPGQVVEVGSARLWIDGGGEAAPRPAAARAATPAATPAAAPARKSRAPAAGARPAGQRSLVQRTKPRIQRGIPTWLVIVLFLGAAGVAIGSYAYVTKVQGKMTAAPVSARIAASREHLAAGNLDEAEHRLDLISAERTITPAERDEIAAIRDEIAERRAQADVDVDNLVGSKYFDVMLQKYESKYLAGEPQPSRVRLFLKRCKEFRERWPDHPKMGWVERQELRFKGFIDLSAPPTWEDVDWEIHYLTGGAPRNYKAAFEMLNEFMRRSSPEERAKAQELWDELVAERVEYHKDKLYQAEYEYNDKKDAAKAVWWLLHAVIWIGDEDMADEAAAFLVKIPDLDVHLRGYEKEYPERYAAVLQHPLVHEYAVEHGMIAAD